MSINLFFKLHYLVIITTSSYTFFNNLKVILKNIFFIYYFQEKRCLVIKKLSLNYEYVSYDFIIVDLDIPFFMSIFCVRFT